MAVNRFEFVPQQQVQQTYVPLPFEELMQAGRQKQADYDLALAQDQANQNMLKIQALPQDIETRNKIIKQYQDEIASKIDEVKGDYSQLIPFARQQARKIEQDRTYGQLGSIQQNYNIAQAHLKDVEERRAKGAINTGGYGLAKNSIQSFQGTQDLGGGRYAQLQPYNPVKSYAVAEEASKFAQTIKDSDLGGLKVDPALAGQYNVFRSAKGVPYNRAHVATAQYILSNPEAVSNIQEELQANGIQPSPAAIQQRALEYAIAPAQAAARVVTDRDIKSDAIFSERAKKLAEGQPTTDYEETSGIEYKPPVISSLVVTKTTKNATDKNKDNPLYDKGNSPYSAPKFGGQEEVGYPQLKGEDKTKFERIVKAFYPNADSKFMNSDEAFNAVRDYAKKVEESKFVEKTPVISGDFIRRGEEGRSTREDATKDLLANYRYRTFYDVKEGEKISGSDPDFLKKLGYTGDKAFENFQKDLQVTGEYSPKNMFTKVTGSEAFADPLAATLNGKDIAVTRSKGELNGSTFKTHKIVNDAYNAVKELPGIPNEVTLNGIKFKIQEGLVDEQNGIQGYILNDPQGNPIKVEHLEDLPEALYQHYNNLQR